MIPIKALGLAGATLFTACTARHEDNECSRIHKQAKVVFAKYDTNHDGRISRQEYQPIIDAEREFDARQVELRRALSDPRAHDQDFDHKDDNADGYLDLEEFIGGICRKGYVDRSPPSIPKD